MSWNWSTEEEKKDYDVKGTVTISTEEYRDLIEKVSEYKQKGQKEHDDWYEEYKKRDKLEKENEKLAKKVEEINTWLLEDETSATKFKLWKVEKTEREDEE